MCVVELEAPLPVSGSMSLNSDQLHRLCFRIHTVTDSSAQVKPPVTRNGFNPLV